MTPSEMIEVLSDCQYPKANFVLHVEPGRTYLQVEYNGTDNTSGEAMTWKGRKWILSEHMTKSELVQTAFKAMLTALEHEAREQFTYKGVSVLDPHYDVDVLLMVRTYLGGLEKRA